MKSVKHIKCEKHNRILIGKNRCVDCKPIEQTECESIMHKMGFSGGLRLACGDCGKEFKPKDCSPLSKQSWEGNFDSKWEFVFGRVLTKQALIDTREEWKLAIKTLLLEKEKEIREKIEKLKPKCLWRSKKHRFEKTPTDEGYSSYCKYCFVNQLPISIIDDILALLSERKGK